MAVARAAGQTSAAIRSMRGGAVRRLAAWLRWYEGWVTLRSIAASLRLRSEGHLYGMIRRCERELVECPEFLAMLDMALPSLR